ncbi:ABC transporter permease [Paenibacillus sp. CMAA1364]
MRAIERVIKTSTPIQKTSKGWLSIAKSQHQLIIMSIPAMLILILFSYVPLWGWIMAFQKYSPAKGVLGSEFTGLDTFRILFKDPIFYEVLRNTIVMSIMSLGAGFIGAIVLALLLNEVKFSLFKRTIQTITYIPHFVSWIVIANIILVGLSPDGGFINELLMTAGIINEPIYFMAEGKWFWWIHTFAGLWKELGWSTIIYLAVLGGVNTELYEAASVDGAGRFSKMWHISIPGLIPTAMMLLILNTGWILSSGFESQFLLGSNLVIEYSQVLDLYAMNYAFSIGDYSLGVAISIFKSIVSIILVLSVNFLARKLDQGKIF